MSKRRQTNRIESLESRRLLSVSASSLAYLLVNGNEWTTRTSDGTIDSYHVLGAASFNGISCTKVDDVTSGNGADSNTTLYVGFDSNKDFVTYGGVVTSTDDSTDPPTTSTVDETFLPYHIDLPASMVAGQTYTSTATLTGSDGTTTNTITETTAITLTSYATTKITVPAGTFSCYQIDETDTDTFKSGTTTDTSVNYYAPGNYPIESIDGTGSDATTTVLTSGAKKQTAAKLAFVVQPSDAQTGAALSPAVAVDVEDSADAQVGDDTSTVSLAIASGPAGGTISGTSSVAAVSGEATFSDLKFSKPGKYTLKATDGSLTSATSSEFTISAATGTPTSLSFQVEPTSAPTGKPLFPAVTVDVNDADGILVDTDTSTVKLSVASGPTGGTVAGTTSVSAVDGTATFTNLTFSTPGTYTLKATDGSLTPSTSATFTILAVASKLAFAVSPGGSVAGKSIPTSVKVDVETSTGAIVPTDSSTVTLSVASGPGKLGGTVTAKAVNGVATFSSLLITTAGTYTLKAIDGALTAAVSSSFVVSAAAASKLVFATEPASTIAGTPIGPVLRVDLEDTYGNLVTTATTNVAIALASGSGTLSGTLTAAAKAGVATFSNLILTKAGSYTLKATGASLTAATTSSFAVSPAAAAKMILTNEPAATTVAGKAISPVLVIDLEDQYGNLATTNTTSVAVTAVGGGALTAATSVAVKSGVATLSNLILDTAGKYTLKITDGSLPAVTTASFNIVPAAAAKLVISGFPTTGKAGVALSPAVKISVEDTFGNIVTTDQSTVAVAISSGPTGGTLGGTTTAAAVSGIASFKNLALSKAGTYELKLTDGKLTSAVSASIKVT